MEDSSSSRKPTGVGRLRFRLYQRQMAWIVLAVAVPLAILGLIAIRTVEEDLIAQAQQKVGSDLNVASYVFKSKGSRVEIVDGKMLLDGRYTVNGSTEVVDAIVGMVGGTATVFQGDTRISTTVRKDDGSRAVGTQVASNVADTVLRQGQRYVGTAWVVNAWYITAYDPLRDPSGQIIGMLYVGTPQKPFTDVAEAFRNRTLLVALLGFLVALVMGWMNARNLNRPIQAMTGAAKDIAEGRVGRKMELDEGRGDELGEMARAFRGMVEYVQGMARAAERIAAGDLSVRVEPRSEDDVLGVAFGRMVESLRELTVEVQSASQSLSQAASEIMAVVSQQSSGAAEHSAAITETTATVDEVAASSEQAVQMAMVVSETAQQADRAASQGVAAIRNSTEGMVSIRQKVQSIAENILALSEQSQQIGEIIATVNDLADQSNLLALNAAIEASRAGEHGKGFAVVASEIRSLAEQSKGATAQVRTILSDIQRATNAAVMATEQGTKGVDTGVQLIDQAGKTIDELAQVVQQAAQSAAQIAAAVRQHSVGMEQIASAMVHINEATNQNLGATNNTKKAAENLSGLAQRLNQLVAAYKVGGRERRGEAQPQRVHQAGPDGWRQPQEWDRGAEPLIQMRPAAWDSVPPSRR